jgi:hypothetical protein
VLTKPLNRISVNFSSTLIPADRRGASCTVWCGACWSKWTKFKKKIQRPNKMSVVGYLNWPLLSSPKDQTKGEKRACMAPKSKNKCQKLLALFFSKINGKSLLLLWVGRNWMALSLAAVAELTNARTVWHSVTNHEMARRQTHKKSWTSLRSDGT